MLLLNFPCWWGDIRPGTGAQATSAVVRSEAADGVAGGNRLTGPVGPVAGIPIVPKTRLGAYRLPAGLSGGFSIRRRAPAALSQPYRHAISAYNGVATGLAIRQTHGWSELIRLVSGV